MYHLSSGNSLHDDAGNTDDIVLSFYDDFRSE